MRIAAYALLSLTILAAGCSSVNQPLNDPKIPLESRARNHTRAATFADAPPLVDFQQDELAPASRPVAGSITDSDGYFVGIAISGGGSRSANFAAACLFQLQRLGLLQKVDYISSVSGGSLTAAYYCLADDQHWNPGVVQTKLTHSFAGDVVLQTIIPWNFLLLMWTDWDRSDLLADSFSAQLYSPSGKSQTFADLRPDRPRLLLNATDLQSGKRFVFCNEQFDQINSDLSAYPICHAVAASAAFPVVMHHVTLRDYSTIFKQYRHLIDGGVTDNLGVETLIQTYDAQMSAAAARKGPEPYPNGAVLIVIDAFTAFDARLASKSDIGFLESLKTGTGLTATSLLARASSATLAEIIVEHSPGHIRADELRRQIETLRATGYLEATDQRGKLVRVVHLSLERVNELSDLPFHSFSESVNNIATYFAIDPAEAHQLYQAADMLVREKFEETLMRIEAELRVDP